MINKSLSTVFFACLLQATFAQVHMVPNTIQTPYGNVSHSYPVGSPHYYYGQGQISAKYRFTVILVEDSTFTAKTRIDFTSDTHSLTIKGPRKQKQKIYPFYTKAIFRVDENGRKIFGIPTDSCWLFKCQPGKINAYSFLAERGMLYVIAIQEGEKGPIVPLTKDNLLPMVGTDPKILKLIEKGKLVKAVAAFNEE